MEALLSRGNVFSTPVSAVKPVDTHNLISDNPFLAPATRPTGPVEAPVAVEAPVDDKHRDQKDKKKSHKSRKDRHSDKDVKSSSSISKTDKKCVDKKSVRVRDRSASPVPRSVKKKGPSSSSPPPDNSSGPESAHQAGVTKGESSSTVGFDKNVTVSHSRSSTMAPPERVQSFIQTGAGFPPQETEHYNQVSEDELELSASLAGSDEGQLSDVTDPPEQTEDMSYRETVRSVRSFMGWHHIPAFETDYAEPDKSNNPWKGKNPRKPTRISVAMPPDDWLCQKLERLNLTVAEGYPSCSQDSAGLKRDQFVKVPKSQGKWYKMHLMKPEEPHRPGRSVLSWRNSEAKVNSQFPRITRASAYPSTGPPSRPLAQESLRRWEGAAREDSYIINHAAGFSRCSTELQEKMSQNITLLCSRLNKGKISKDVTNALNDLRDLMAFHQKVSVAMGMSLQHLADSLFVNMSNLVLLRRDAYLEFVKQGVKPDTMNLLRNAPLFGYGLFPDAAIMTAEPDIQKFEASSVAQRPGPGASQHTSWKSSHRYKPYDRKDRKPAASSDQSGQQQQPWRQFGRGRPSGRGSTLVFPRCIPTNNTNDNYLVGPNYSHVNQVQRDPQFQDKVVSESQTLQTYQTLTSSVCTETLNPQDVCCPAVFRVHSVRSRGPPQKKGVSPALYQSRIKHVKGVCCVNPCRFVPSVPSVPNAVPEQAVGGRLQRFWQVWQNMGANPRVVSILKEGYTLPFKQRPLLVRFPLVQSGYASPIKNLLLKEALLTLNRKLVVEKLVVKSSLAFYNRLFLVPKPNKKWRPILDESVKCIPKHRHLQNGNPGDDPVVLDNRRVGHIAGLQ